MRVSRKALVLLSLTLLFVSLSSCTNTIIKVLFNKDGSGHYTFIEDYSGVKDMLGMFGEEKLKKEMEEENVLTMKSDALLNLFQSVEGISNAKSSFDMEKLQSIIEFDFKDMAALNAALDTAFGQLNLKSDLPFFEQTKSSISRTSRELWTAGTMDSIMALEADDMSQMFEQLNRDSYYELVLQFEEKIKNYSNSDYQKIDDHTISWKQFITSELDKDMKIGVTVKLK